MGLPEAAETIHRLAKKWNIPHDKTSFDKLGIGRNFPNHLARWGITMAIPYAGEGRPQDPSSFVNLRTEAGWKLRNRLDMTIVKRAAWSVKGNPTPHAPRSTISNSSGRSTFALARTMSGWSMSCDH